MPRVDRGSFVGFCCAEFLQQKGRQRPGSTRPGRQRGVKLMLRLYRGSLGRTVAAACLSLSSLWIAAQSNRGGVSGTITDQQGLVVPNATVTVINTGTNKAVKVTASSS